MQKGVDDHLINLLIHDLTGPLSIISTGVKNLLEKEGRYGRITEKQRDTLNMVLRNADRARHFLHEIIEIYRSKEGFFKKREINVAEVIKESILTAMEITNQEGFDEISSAKDEDFVRVLDEKGVSLSITGKYSVKPFSHDPEKIRHIMVNLITNALKYKRRRVDITVSGDYELTIAVKDDGPGIPDEKKAYVFKGFFLLENKTRHAPEGLGFGLSCVKALVEMLNGKITLTSGGGEGTCFTVQLPPLDGQ